MNINSKTAAIAFLACIGVLILTSALVNWYRPPTTPPKEFVKADPIPALGKVPKVSLSVPKVQVYDKPTAVKQLPGLPKELVDNTDLEIMASATTGPSKAGFNVVSVLDKNTGDSSIYYKEKERGLFEFVNEKRIGIAYGISSDKGQQLGKVYGEWTFFRAGEAHLSVQTELRAKQLQQTEAVGMLSIDYRW